jgi:hypothetical protein
VPVSGALLGEAEPVGLLVLGGGGAADAVVSGAADEGVGTTAKALPPRLGCVPPRRVLQA